MKTARALGLPLAELARHARDVRFVPALSRTTVALAVTIGVGSWLTEIAATTARWSWVLYPDEGDQTAAGITDLAIEWVSLPQAIEPNWPMLGVAAILGVLAYIVRSGEGLQRETEGLV